MLPRRPAARIALSALLLAGSALLYAGARDRELVTGPYLASPGPSRVSIRGFSRAKSRWSVEPIAAGGPRIDEMRPTTIHELTLSDLPLDSVIEVQVLSDGMPLAGGRLRVRTDPGSGGTLDFAVVGDSGGHPDRVLELLGATPAQGARLRPDVIAGRISAVRPQLLLHTGDVVYPRGARDDAVRAFFRPFAPVIATAPVAAAVGNHDLKTEDGALFLDVFGEDGAPPKSEGKYRSFEYGPLHVAVLDSNEEDAELLDSQVRWLAADLAATSKPWRIVLSHVPLAFSSEAQRTRVSAAQRRISDALREACEAGHVAVVFAGHHHWFERSRPLRGITHVTTGGGGRSVVPFEPGDFAAAESSFHFVHGRVSGNSMTLRAIRDDGTEIDRVILERP